MMEERDGKLIRAGMVAVIVSPGFGAGWSTWGKMDCFDPVVAKAVLNNEPLEALLEERYPGEYQGGSRDLVVEWLPVGTRFKIDEYDGFESIVTADSLVQTA